MTYIHHRQQKNGQLARYLQRVVKTSQWLPVTLFLLACSSDEPPVSDLTNEIDPRAIATDSPSPGLNYSFYQSLQIESVEIDQTTTQFYEPKEDKSVYVVIAGTFYNKEAANRVSTHLTEKGFINTIARRDRADGTQLYQVRLSPVIGGRRVSQLQNRLAKIGMVKTYHIKVDN